MIYHIINCDKSKLNILVKLNTLLTVLQSYITLLAVLSKYTVNINTAELYYGNSNSCSRDIKILDSQGPYYILKHRPVIIAIIMIRF